MTALPGRLVAEDIRVRYRTSATAYQTCGVDCVFVCMQAVGRTDVPLSTLEKELPVGPQGVSLAALTDACRTHDLSCLVVRTDLAGLKRYDVPMILHVQGNHFLALLGVEDGRLVLFDNRVGLLDCTPEWFSKKYRWDGIALAVGTPSPPLVFAVYGPGLLVLVCGVGLFICVLRYLLVWQSAERQPGTGHPEPPASLAGVPKEVVS